MLTNLVWAPISSFDDIRCSGNWMWPAETSNGKGLLYLAVKEVTDVLCNLGIGTNTFFLFFDLFFIFFQQLMVEKIVFQCLH